MTLWRSLSNTKRKNTKTEDGSGYLQRASQRTTNQPTVSSRKRAARLIWSRIQFCVHEWADEAGGTQTQTKDIAPFSLLQSHIQQHPFITSLPKSLSDLSACSLIQWFSMYYSYFTWCCWASYTISPGMQWSGQESLVRKWKSMSIKNSPWTRAMDYSGPWKRCMKTLLVLHGFAFLSFFLSFLRAWWSGAVHTVHSFRFPQICWSFYTTLRWKDSTLECQDFGNMFVSFFFHPNDRIMTYLWPTPDPDSQSLKVQFL